MINLSVGNNYVFRNTIHFTPYQKLASLHLIQLAVNPLSLLAFGVEELSDLAKMLQQAMWLLNIGVNICVILTCCKEVTHKSHFLSLQLQGKLLGIPNYYHRARPFLSLLHQPFISNSVRKSHCWGEFSFFRQSSRWFLSVCLHITPLCQSNSSLFRVWLNFFLSSFIHFVLVVLIHLWHTNVLELNSHFCLLKKISSDNKYIHHLFSTTFTVARVYFILKLLQMSFFE